jgi:hypothetical protein
MSSSSHVPSVRRAKMEHFQREARRASVACPTARARSTAGDDGQERDEGSADVALLRGAAQGAGHTQNQVTTDRVIR